MANIKTSIQTCKGHLEYCVLQIISRGETQISDLIAELIDVNLIKVEGRIYPILNQMYSNLLITHRQEEILDLGLIQKIYSITPEGKTELKALSNRWNALVNATNQITSKN